MIQLSLLFVVSWVQLCLFVFILSHENKKALRSFYHKKIFLIEYEYKTSYEYLTFTFDQNYFWPFKRQSHKMVKHTQVIHREFADNDKMDLWLFYFHVTIYS